MPKLRKCCVERCDANFETHRLFSFPKDDKLRELWLSFVIPYANKLKGLTKAQLTSKFVCQRHFDRHQFNSVGNRLTHGYPCLFTSDEILHGIPLRDSGDHNYTKAADIQKNSDSHQTTETTDFKAPASTEPCTSSNKDAALNQYYNSFASTCDVEGSNASPRSQMNQSNSPPQSPARHSPPPTSTSEHGPLPSASSLAVSKLNATKLITETSSFVKAMKKLAAREQTLQKPFSKRIEAAQNLSHTQLFNQSFDKMSQKAQDFLLLQLKSASKTKQARRYTTNEKLLSLSLMEECPKGYEFLQKIFNFPSKKTLDRLAQKVIFDVGINENIFSLIKQKAVNWDIKKKLCSILFDEVALTQHLKNIKSQNKIIQDFGDEGASPFCGHALILMLRGVCTNWRQPIAYYFCEGTTTAASIIEILKEVVTKVTESGLIPLAVVCDHRPTFRSALNMLIQETVLIRSLNGDFNDGTVNISGQSLSVVYDPPHLLKSVRNNLLTKDMLFNGKLAKWEDIKTVYEADCKLGHTRINKKLTDHHIYAAKIKEMNVKVAAQTLSRTTSAMLKYTALFRTTAVGETVSETMSTTGEAVEFFDNLFDSVNGSQKGTVKGKLRGPIKPNSKHFAFWIEAKNVLQNITFLNVNDVYRIRAPCLDGWLTTIESFERLSKLLLDTYQVHYFYPRHVNKDPLENFFGQNPDVSAFTNSLKTLVMSNAMGPHSIYGNCEDDGHEKINDFLKLSLKNVNSTMT